MTQDYDVAARLAQGQQPLEVLQEYVLACRQVGYQHPQLERLGYRYRADDGLDLFALQWDCDALHDAGPALHEALAVQEHQLRRLSAVWQGSGGHVAREFLRRHGEASAAVTVAVGTAAEAVRALREDLWQAVGSKVDAVVEIEGRAASSRAEWTAAAATLTTGAGDRATASETVDRAVKPFVDSAIRDDLVGAMDGAARSVTTAYARAVAEIDSEPTPVFGVPGDLGPAYPPAPQSPAVAPAPTAPAAAIPLSPSSAPPPVIPFAAPAPAHSAPAAAPAAPLLSPAAAPMAAADPGPVPPPPTTPAATPLSGLGGGLSGLGQQFADSLSGLLGGRGNDALPEIDAPPEIDEPDEPDVNERGDREENEKDDEENDDEFPADDSPADVPPVNENEVPEAEEPPADGSAIPPTPVTAPAPPPAAPPAEPLTAAPEPVAAGQTPCEIAAGEVPQVGEPDG